MTGNTRVYKPGKPAELRPKDSGPQGTFVPVSHTFGYARVSRGDSQSLDRQVFELTAAGASQVFTDETSGAKATIDRPGFSDLVSHLRPGDIVVVVELSRLSRSLNDLMQTVDTLVEKRNVTVRVLNGLGEIGGASPTARLLLQVLGAVAELERSLIQERALSGLAQARRSGVRLGRPPALNAQQLRTVRAMRAAGASAAEVSSALSVSERTVRRASAEADSKK